VVRPALLLSLALLAACNPQGTPTQRDIAAAFIAADRLDYSCAERSSYDTIQSRFFPQTLFIRQSCTYEHGRVAYRIVGVDGGQAIPLGNAIGFSNLLARHAPLVIAREDAAEYALFVAQLTGQLDQPFHQLSSPDQLPDSLRRYYRTSTAPVMIGAPARLAHFWIPIYHPSSEYNPGYLWRLDGSVILGSGAIEFNVVRLWEEPLPAH
jgi:hypothetical protein